MKVLKYTYIIFVLLLLVYLLLPAPTKVEDFNPLPDSLKSKEPGDTIQQPHIAAYFSDFYRRDVIPFYMDDFKDKFKFFGISLPFVRLNHPPEYASEVVRPIVQSYYLEEFVYPLRESLFVSGWEPYDETGRPRFKYSHPINIDNQPFKTKVTVRYYPSAWWVRFITWMGIVLAIPALYYLYGRVLTKND